MSDQEQAYVEPTYQADPGLNFHPLGEFVLIQPIPDPGTFANGQLLLPESAKERPQQGVIVGVGSGVLTDEGYRVNPEVVVGDRVLYAKYGGTDITVEGVDFVILKERDIMVVFHD